jgi:hypothetical protein
MEIKKEIPSWVIDWVNKVFTTLNNIAQVDDIFLDWAIYTTFSYVDNVITLDDAPNISLFVDYSTSIENSDVWTDITLWDILTKIWNLLGQKQTSTTFNRTILIQEINRISRQILRGRVKSILNPNQIFRCWDFWFMVWHQNYRNQAGWILSEVINVWDTTVTVWTASLLPSGYALVWWDIIKYTSKTDTTLLWVSWITIEHLEWENIYQLYELPADFEKANKINLTNWAEIPFATNTSSISYSILRTWNTQLLRITNISDQMLFKLEYVKKYSNLSLDGDLCVFPDDYGLTVLAPMVAWKLAFEKNLPTAQSILVTAYETLQNMLQFFTNTINVRAQSIKVQPYAMVSINRFKSHN